MRASEFLFLKETNLRNTSNIGSLRTYVQKALEFLNSSNPPPSIDISTGGTNIDYTLYPDAASVENLEKEWKALDKTALDQPDSFKYMKKIWGIQLQGIVKDIVKDADGNEKTVEKTVTVTFGNVYKDKKFRIAKDWNTGNVTEGFFSAAIYLRLQKATDITKVDLINFVKKLGASGKTIPDRNSASTQWSSEPQDNLFLRIRLSAGNMAALKDPDVHILFNKHLQGIVDYVNTVEIERVQKWFAENGIVDEILVKGLGPEDEKGSKVDIAITYHNADMADSKQYVAYYERSVKTRGGSQFGQEAVGGASYDSKSYHKGEGAPPSKEQGKEKEDIIQRRWEKQLNYWNSLGINISTVETDFKKSWKTAWDNKGKDWLDTFLISYNEALAGFNNLKRSRNSYAKFFKGIQFHAMKDNPDALVTNFDEDTGYYEELDFTKLDNFLDNISDEKVDLPIADLKATVALINPTKKELKTNPEFKGKAMKWPTLRIISGSAGEANIINSKGKSNTIKWKANEVLLQLRLYVNSGKVTNLLEKGNLLKKWTLVASNAPNNE